MSYDVLSEMRPDCFRGKGDNLSRYVYEWMLNDVTIYVGRGVGNRYKKFYISRKYGTRERHDFVLAHKDRLTCRFAVANVALEAAMEAEALLIQHWGLRPGGSLFNARVEPLPSLDDLGEDRRASARFNVPAIVPPPEECMFYDAFYGDVWSVDKRAWDDDDLIDFTGNPTCWKQIGKKGWRFDNEVLRTLLPATVGTIVEFAQKRGISRGEVRGKHKHLDWGCDKNYLRLI